MLYLSYKYSSVQVVIIYQLIIIIIITSGACNFIPIKSIILQTLENILEQLCINNVLVVYYNSILVIVIISLLVGPTSCFDIVF